MSLLLRLLVLCLWPLGPLSASEILLIGAEDQPGIRSFVAALENRRPHDHVHFQTTADLPSPGKLKADQRLILLDNPALDWRLSETAGPPAWSCASAAFRLSSAWESRARRFSPSCGMTRHRPVSCAWRVTCCPRHGVSACCTASTVGFCSRNCAMRHGRWAWKS